MFWKILLLGLNLLGVHISWILIKKRKLSVQFPRDFIIVDYYYEN